MHFYFCVNLLAQASWALMEQHLAAQIMEFKL